MTEQRLEQFGQQLALVQEVLYERRRQDDQWGGPAHDDQHSDVAWIELLMERVERFALRQLGAAGTGTEYRKLLLQLAALSLAALESYDRKAARHTNDQG